jgi:hypothetical protein
MTSKRMLVGTACLALLTNAISSLADDWPSALLAKWSAEGSAQDSVGVNHGTIVGGVGYAKGIRGQTFTFDGASGYIDVTNTGDLDFGTNDFSICAWVYFASWGGGLSTDQDILQRSLGTYPNDRSYLLEYAATETPPVLRFVVRDSTSNQNDMMLPSPITVDEWYHIAAVRTGNTNRLFLDGSLLGEQTAGSNVDLGSGGETRIGALVHWGPGRYFRGAIDELAVFGRALSESEIARLATMPPLLSLRETAGQMDLSWTSKSNRVYEVQCSPDLSSNSWSTLVGSIVATASMTVTNDPAFGQYSQRFYRVVTPEP